MPDHDRDRSDVTGEFVSDEFAAANPATTSSEDARAVKVSLTSDAKAALAWLQASSGGTARDGLISVALVQYAAALGYTP
ncbi:hypothetical protein [uncultured Jatrophihabitans sp.]|uniref:hypothetical protein n=1 Tax=uncultured Jatrophihabitans sp. TaxID=1610747 RepID=UPI0035CC612D